MASQNNGADATLYNTTNNGIARVPRHDSFTLKASIAEMLRDGAVVVVRTVEEAKIAQSAGACSVLLTCSQRCIPDPFLIQAIRDNVSIPVMVRSRVGHFVEAQILEKLNVDYIDESELLGIADGVNFVNKHNFSTAFVCGCTNLGEALRRIQEGAVLIRTQGDFLGRGDIVQTVKNVRGVMGQINFLRSMDEDEVFAFAKMIEAPYDLVVQTRESSRLPVMHFASGGILTPADGAMMKQLGCDGVFVGSDVFDCPDPHNSIRGIVQGVKCFHSTNTLVEASCPVIERAGNYRLNGNRIEVVRQED